MKKIIAIFLLNTFTIYAAQAALKFDKYVIDGNIPIGTLNYEFAFNFKNEGETSIRLKSVKTDCGCTIAKNDKDIYLPGEFGEIKGTFSAKDMVGKQEKEIYIETDNLGQPKINLFLRMQIESMISIKPSLVYWKKSGNSDEKLVSLEINDKIKPESVSIHSDNENFILTIIADKNNPQHLTLKIKPISTDDSLRGLIKINVKQDGQSKTFFVHTTVK